MSGGVDSSVAASIIKEKGYQAVGISLQLWNYSESDNRFGTCCSLDDLADARRVAEKVGIPFYILNMEKKFKEEVVDYFISEYMQARTPIPCTLCNQKLKFDEIYSKVNNKNKWGSGDRLGTINYITNEKVLSALKIPNNGVSVSLAFNMVDDSTRINSSTYDHLSKFSYKQNIAEPVSYTHLTLPTKRIV